jgi:hypothetical protein
VQKRILPLAVTAVLLISLISLNCTKLDTTDIGGDQLPAVDNVNTFADTLDIISTQESYFSDSTYIGKYDDYAVGGINNDPLFGTTNASIFMQLKPAFYPFFFGNAGDTIRGISGVGIDSIILCLKYKGFWGDSTLPITLQVREVQDGVFQDSVLKENKTNVTFTTGTVLGSSTVNPLTIGNYIKYNYGRDSINNQIRIPITNLAWVNALFGRDSIKANAGTNAFYSDSAYRRLYNQRALAVMVYCMPAFLILLPNWKYITGKKQKGLLQPILLLLHSGLTRLPLPIRRCLIAATIFSVTGVLLC